MTLNALKWFSEIFNYTKQRSASQRQLSFLSRITQTVVDAFLWFFSGVFGPCELRHGRNRWFEVVLDTLVAAKQPSCDKVKVRTLVTAPLTWVRLMTSSDFTIHTYIYTYIYWQQRADWPLTCCNSHIIPVTVLKIAIIKTILLYKTYNKCLSITRRYSFKIHLAKFQQEHVGDRVIKFV